MSQAAAIALGAIAGATIFLGLRVARMRGLPTALQGVLNAFATGILVFLLWDILSHAGAPVEESLSSRVTSSPLMAGGFGIGIAAGLLGLVSFNRALFGRLRHGAHAPAPRNLAMAIATGLGLHNLSEGLAIGQSARAGAIAFAGVLGAGCALHNTTEGFGISAPMTPDTKPVSGGFLALAAVIRGAAPLHGAAVGYRR